MSGLKLCIDGIVPMSVPIEYLGDDGKTHRNTFTAKVRDLSQSEIDAAEADGRRMIDLVLHGVGDITLTRTDGTTVPEDELLATVKDSAQLSAAVLSSYAENFLRKTPRRRT